MKSRLFLVVCAVLSVAPLAPAQADPGPVPEPCRLHPVHVVHPGCEPAVAEAVDRAGDELVPHEVTYPDLVPNVEEILLWRLPSYDPATGIWTWGEPELWFDTRAMNMGDVPLDLLADDPSDPNGGSVSQCVSWTTDLVCRDRRTVGGFTWHAPHEHFHFEDFASYQFRRTLADGTPDYSAAGLVAVSEKVSFCLLDSAPARDDAFPVRRYNSCNGTNQGISPGWADVYTWDLPGQQFPLSGIEDGRYALVVDMDTANHVFETDDLRNRVEITVDITGGATAATIVGRRWP